MTRKDYELIAAALRRSSCEVADRTSDYGDGVRTQFNVTASMLATALESTNPRFDRSRFLKACGV